ncbi:MAG: biotin transporter BioY [Ruminococcus sp.]|nr:biotin transporter BioY [Ruminococcus sp.]
MENTIAHEAPKKRLFTTRELTYTALMAVLIIVCSWISIPTPWNVSFTLQTFAVFFSLVLLGGKCGTFSVLTFLLLGAVGLPVFSGFKGGVSALFGLTGGYILGFLLTALIYWLAELIPAKGAARIVRNIAAMLVGLAACYLFGTLWFMHVYAIDDKVITFSGALALCVVPYLAFDLAKLALAVILGESLRKLIKVK